ncbi:MAG: PqqD family protein [Oscillospiraceae bacterium]|nr:PqqD family protein [Oscillospiraceae bacterium]
MKLNSGFLAHDDGDQKLLVSTGETKFSGLVRTNSTAGFIIECLENETTEDEIVAKMQQKWDVSDEIARADVRKIVDQLKSIGAIDG